MQLKKKKIIADILFYLVIAIVLACSLIFLQGVMSSERDGGYRFFEVLTSSMESVYPKGSLVFVKKIDSDELKVDDDITFIRKSGLIVTHRIIETKENYSDTGQRAFVTKGVDNAMPDEEIILDNNVIGKVTNSIPKLGTVISVLRDNVIIILIVVISFAIASFCTKILWKEFKRKKDASNGERPAVSASDDENSNKENLGEE